MTLDESLNSRFADIRVVGDVYGEADSFPVMLSEAEAADLRGGSVYLNCFSGLISGISAVVMKMMDPRSGTA